jgi:hypothetical protein
MIWLRAAVVGVLSALGLAGVSGCSHGDPKPNYSSVTDTPSVTTSSSSASGAPSRSPGSAAPTSVPVNQIPPGRPAKWVPAGVPTVAPYKEPGDLMPMFTLTMFKNDQLGALAAARYYLDARNWTIATMDPTPFLIICDATKCKTDANFFRDAKAKDRRVIGSRQTPGPPSVVRAPKNSGAEWVVQTTLNLASGRIVSKNGATVEEEGHRTQVINLYMRWNGTMWRVADDALAG